MAVEKGSSSFLDKEKANLSVLIVDDDAVIRKFHSMLVKKSGIEVRVAVGGQEAVELHRERKSFDLILMDMEMPIMNGLEATKEIREMIGYNKCMIVGVTSHVEESEMEAFVKAGANFCCAKPMNLQKLSYIFEELAKFMNQQN